MKKLVTRSTLLVFAVLPMMGLAQGYTTELQSAYSYAYDIGITTQPTINTANMYGTLIRSHMAKMIVNYAQKVLGLSPDQSLSCEFADIASQSAELKGYIKEACQLWLMGLQSDWTPAKTFNPNGTVTRAQFGTVLSRTLYGDVYNTGSPYYTKHLNALKLAGIMTKIDSPDMEEVRWYVMLMMMRAAANANHQPSQCDNSEIQFLCLIGSSTCPGECQSSIGATIGNVQVTPTRIDVGTLPTGTQYLGSLRFVASNSDIMIQSITFQKVGAFTK